MCTILLPQLPRAVASLAGKVSTAPLLEELGLLRFSAAVSSADRRNSPFTGECAHSQRRTWFVRTSRAADCPATDTIRAGHSATSAGRKCTTSAPRSRQVLDKMCNAPTPEWCSVEEWKFPHSWERASSSGLVRLLPWAHMCGAALCCNKPPRRPRCSS